MTSIPTHVVPAVTQAYGVALYLFPGDPEFSTEVQRAPDDGMGSPDIGNAEIVGTMRPGQAIFVDTDVGASSDTFHYRMRHVRAQYQNGTWSSWVVVQPVQLPDVLPPLPSRPNLIPQVREEVSSSGSTGIVTLTVTDPDLRVTAVEFQEKVGRNDYGGTWLTSWDTTSGTPGTDETLTRGESVSLDVKHVSAIKYRVTYTDPNGDSQEIGGHVPFDVDHEAEIQSCTITFDEDGNVDLWVVGDDDCDDIYVRVDDDPFLSDPTSVSNNGALTTRAGEINTSFSTELGETVYVKVRGENHSGSLGPTRTFQRRRGDAATHPPRVEFEAFRSGTSASVNLNVDDPAASITAVDERIREGDGSDTGFTSWSPSSGTIGSSTALEFDDTITVDPGQDTQFEYRITWTDENGVSRTISSGPIHLSNLEDGSGFTDVAAGSIKVVGSANELYLIEDGTSFDYVHPSTGASAVVGELTVQLPRGARVTSFETWLYAEDTSGGDEARARLYELDSGGKVLQYDNTHPGGGADGTWSKVTATGTNVIGDAVVVWIRLDSTGAAVDVRFAKARINYDRDTWENVL